VQRSRNLLRFQSEQSSGGIAFLECRRYPKELSSQRKQRLRHLKLHKISQGEGGSSKAHEGAQLSLDRSTVSIRSAGETRSGPSSFMSRQQEERAQGRRILDLGRQI
jgi:hypothetical protein